MSQVEYNRRYIAKLEGMGRNRKAYYVTDIEHALIREYLSELRERENIIREGVKINLDGLIADSK